MASILLPTHKYTNAVEQLLAQLTPDDELLLIADQPTDPIVADPPQDLRTALDDPGQSVRILTAGEPEACSGKANAIAHGLEQASPDQSRFILTDDDFKHDPDWLARLKRLGERHPEQAVSGVPIFVSDGLAWQLFEPLATVSVSLGFLLRNDPWAGCLTFTREQVDLDGYTHDLRQTVTDDGVLEQNLTEPSAASKIHSTRLLSAEVSVDGSLRAVRNRAIRSTQILSHGFSGSILPGVLASFVLLAGFVLLPVLTGAVVTLGTAGVYRYFSVKRRTWLLAAPSLFISLLCLPYCATHNEFWWAGRKYRWSALFDVEILETENKAESESEEGAAVSSR